jgi:hypothetical protein
MKLVRALAIAVILLTLMAPVALAADSGVTVYVSVSVDGELLVAAQPVTVTEMTVDAVIKAAHEEFYSGGISGYAAGIDPMWNMYLITKCWGITATPYVIVNNAPLGSDLSVPATPDVAPVAANDNIIICTGSDMMNNPVQPISLKSTLSDGSATVTATLWTLDFMTFMYSSAPLPNANVIDPTTGASLGTTDADGKITVTVPDSGIIAIEGLAAINVNAIPTSAPAASTSAAPTSSAAGSVTVYVSVSVDSQLLVAAQPITITDTTVDGAIKAAHEEFYSGGLSGYTAGIDAMFNMYLITQCWGITATPYVIVNGAPLGADQTNPMTVDTYTLVANDNIIICTGTDMMNNPVQPVSLTTTVSGDSATVTATLWTLDFMTFMYSSAPLAGANVIDPTTGASLGTTDADGQITVTVPASGVVAIEGLAAINVKAASAPAAPTSGAPAATTPTTEYPFIYEYSIILIVVGAVILIPIAVVIITKMVRQSRTDKVIPSIPISTFAAPASALGGTAPASAARPSISARPETVYVSVSVDGKLLVAAKPVTITEMTVQGAIKAAHKEYYSGGEGGYSAGIDPAFNMYLVTRCWGVRATPYVVVNGTPLGASPLAPSTIDIAPVAANDNIIICTSSDPMGRPAQPVSLAATVSGDSATVTATAWTLNMSTFTYSATLLANANVIDPTTGATLGTTDANGQITVTVPDSGVVAIEGLAAIAVAPGKRK